MAITRSWMICKAYKHWKVLISDETDSAGYNVITFKFHFNTETISTKAAKDVYIQFTAMDKGSPAITGGVLGYGSEKYSTPGTVSTTTNTLTGCYNAEGLETLAYAVAIGIDKGENDKIRLSLQFAVLSESNSEGSRK